MAYNRPSCIIPGGRSDGTINYGNCVSHFSLPYNEFDKTLQSFTASTLRSPPFLGRGATKTILKTALYSVPFANKIPPTKSSGPTVGDTSFIRSYFCPAARKILLTSVTGRPVKFNRSHSLVNSYILCASSRCIFSNTAWILARNCTPSALSCPSDGCAKLLENVEIKRKEKTGLIKVFRNIICSPGFIAHVSLMPYAEK